MFFGCNSLISIDLSNFDFSECVDMGYFFYKCTSLISIDFPNISYVDVSKVSIMEGVFSDCSSLKEIDLSQWFANSLKYMKYIFYGFNSFFILSVLDNLFIYMTKLSEVSKNK